MDAKRILRRNRLCARTERGDLLLGAAHAMGQLGLGADDIHGFSNEGAKGGFKGLHEAQLLPFL